MLILPKNLPPLFDGDKTVFYGILQTQGGDAIDQGFSGEVELTGSILGAKISHNLTFDIAAPSSQSSQEQTLLPVHHLAAKHLIEDMKQDEKPSTDIVKLSIEAQVISKETAFIAVYEDTSKAVTGPMKTYDLHAYTDVLPANIASNIDQLYMRGETLDSLEARSDLLSAQSAAFYKASKKSSSSGFGWISSVGSSIAGLFNLGGSSNNELMEDMMESNMQSASEISGCLTSDSLIDDEEGEEDGFNDLFSQTRVQEKSKKDQPLGIPTLPKPTVAGGSAAIILIQQANGSWLLDESFASSIGLSLNTLESSCPSGCDKTVWATVLAVTTLRIRYSSQQDEWELVVSKASSWLKSQTSETQLKELIDAAKGIL